MPFKIPPSTVKAITQLVETFDRHRFGAVALSVFVLSVGVSVYLGFHA